MARPYIIMPPQSTPPTYLPPPRYAYSTYLPYQINRNEDIAAAAAYVEHVHTDSRPNPTQPNIDEGGVP